LVVAALPCFSYESLAMHLQDAEDALTPLIEMGRFTRQGDRLMLPYALHRQPRGGSYRLLSSILFLAAQYGCSSYG
jgi:hypothetical protein